MLTERTLYAAQKRGFKLNDAAYKYTQLAGLSTTLGDGTVEYDYAELLAQADYLAATYPSVCSVETVTTLASGKIIKAVRIRDDGVRPLVFLSMGIHGEEIAYTKGVFQVAEELCKATATVPIVTDARLRLGFVFICTTNPDGVFNQTRNNANNVNLNRNWPWFWDQCQDTDKGLAASNQPEVIAIQSWAESWIKRVVVCCDWHGWNSRNTWGFLTEQIYNSPESEQAQRNLYNTVQTLVAARNWSGYTLVGGTPVLTEYRSHHKPYLYTWFRNKMALTSCAFLLETPQVESDGAISTFALDVLLGMFSAAMDIHYSSHIHAVPVTPALTVMNNNSLFDTFNGGENRPDWFSYTRCALSDYSAGAHSFCLTPDSTAVKWPEALMRSAYCSVNNELYSVAGKSISGTQSSVYRQKSDGTQEVLYALPTVAQYAASASDGTYLWAYGGVDASTVYLDKLYKKTLSGNPAWDAGTSVTLSGSPLAIQRHTMHYWSGDLYIVGGRTSASVLTAVYKLNTSTGVATLFATLPAATQRHRSALFGNYLYIFGGDAGATVRTTIYKINMSTAAVTTLSATLPLARIRQSIAVTGTKAYLAFGNALVTPTVEADWKSEIFEFNLADETCSTLSYSLETVLDDEGNDVAIPTPRLADGIGHYNSVTDRLIFTCGELYTGDPTDKTYELDPYSKILGDINSPSTLHSYLRSTQSFSVATGEQYLVAMKVSNELPINVNYGPHVCPVIVVGALSAPTRVVDAIRRVPPKKPLMMSMPLTVRNTDVMEIRAYLRFWNPARKIRIHNGMQLIKETSGTKAVAAFDLVPDGVSSTSVTRVVSLPSAEAFHTTTPGGFGNVFSPYWGSKQKVDQDVMVFAVTGGLSDLRLHYTSTDTDAEAPTGNFSLLWNDGSAQSYNFPVIEINHSRTSIEYRGDHLFWRIIPSATGLVFELWFYGKLLSKAVTCAAGTVTGYTMSGSGVLDGEDVQYFSLLG